MHETNVDTTSVEGVLEDGGVKPAVPQEGQAVKPWQKRNRETYNAYQREYMKAYRKKRKEHG